MVTAFRRPRIGDGKYSRLRCFRNELCTTRRGGRRLCSHSAISLIIRVPVVLSVARRRNQAVAISGRRWSQSAQRGQRLRRKAGVPRTRTDHASLAFFKRALAVEKTSATALSSQQEPRYIRDRLGRFPPFPTFPVFTVIITNFDSERRLEKKKKKNAA